MVALPQDKMTVDEYLAWAESHPGRYELYAGTVYAMSPERARHGEVKYSVQTALLSGTWRSGVPCRMLPDGMTVRVDKDTAYEPDALVYCGDKVPGDSVEVHNPAIVVEVHSPSTRHIDPQAKLAGYLSVESVQHYLIVDPDKPLVVHHARGRGEVIETRILHGGPIRLDPPGFEVTVEEFYPTAD